MNTMSKVCSCCHRVYGWITCSPENAGKVSHGVCATCYKRIMSEMDKRGE